MQMFHLNGRDVPGCLMVVALILCPGSAAAAEANAAPKDTSDWAAVVPIVMVVSRPSGDVPLDTGFGGEFGVGLRGGRVTVGIVLGSSFHKIKDGGQLVLGDSANAASDWEISWFGVDGQYAFRHGHRGQPFLSLEIAGSFLTRGMDNNVEGWRFSAGAGYEYSLRRAVSLSVQAQVDRLRWNKAKAAGRPIDLPEPFDETVLTLRVGLNLLRRF